MRGLSCPNCENALHKQANGTYACKPCKLHFPTLAGVPFVWPNPAAALADWRNRFNMTLADLDQQIELCARATPATQAGQTRLAHLANGLATHRTELNKILEPLKVGVASSKELHLALGTNLLSHHGVLSYLQNVHRDWVWGEAENVATNELLIEMLGASADSVAHKRILVMGSGAGRLAYDLHEHLKPTQTLALDSNPFLCLIAQKLSHDEALELTEFPATPIDADHVSIQHSLNAREPLEGLDIVCADALRPPAAAASFDLVVTPWLVDVIDTGLGSLMDCVAHVLKPGGHWLNHGSLAFQGAQPEHRLTSEEIPEIAAAHGFGVVLQRDDRLPYLQSPASRGQREELTHSWLAVRDANDSAYVRESIQHLPSWMTSTDQPVPLSPGIQTQAGTTRIHAFIMALVDGQRSIKDMAKVMEDQRLMPAQEAIAAIQGFLGKMHEEAVHFEGRKHE